MHENFDMFESHSSGRGYDLKSEYDSNFGSPAKISYINRFYSFFAQHRHTLFHWDTPEINIDTTRMISNKNECDKLIKDSLNLINEYYKLK